MEIESERAWKGWWNEQIVELINLSMEQNDALTILLTGRSEHGFAALIKKMVETRGMDFDMIVLKPKVLPTGEKAMHTMDFKQAFLRCLIETYKEAEEIRIYEDRPKHVAGFRNFFVDYNRKQNGIGGVPTRGPIDAEAIQVVDGATCLDPVVETTEIQRLVDDHNKALEAGDKGRKMAIKKTVFFTGYLLQQADTEKLLTLVPPQPGVSDQDIKYMGNSIMICPRPAPPSILEKVGGLGNKLLWEVTRLGSLNNKLWAVQVRPLPHSAKYYTENPAPVIVLAVKKGARPVDANSITNWEPVTEENSFVFETTVGEKVLLRVEEEDAEEGEYESLFPNRHKRRYGDRGSAGQSSPTSMRVPSGPSGRGNGGYRGDSYSGRGGRGGYPTGPRDHQRDNGRGRGGYNNRGRGGGRGRGNLGANYKSLDDVGGESRHGGGVQYEDFPSLPTAHQKRQTENQRNNQNDFDDRGDQGGGYRVGSGKGRGGGNVGDYY